jgi:glycosyltransferase involved in cell wall biosynthesis
MKLSIVTPIFNGSDFVRALLERLCIQSGNFEHILQIHASDHASCLIAAEFAGRYNLKIYIEDDRGLYDAINRGFSKATGDILGWIGVDDILFADGISTILKFFSVNPNAMWVSGIPSYRILETPNAYLLGARILRVPPQKLIAAGFFRDGELGFLQQESIFWRRELWCRVNGAQILSKYKLAADFWLWRAFASVSPMHVLCAPLAAFTVRDGQLSHSLREQYNAECGKGHSTLAVLVAKVWYWGSTFFPGSRLSRLRLALR